MVNRIYEFMLQLAKNNGIEVLYEDIASTEKAFISIGKYMMMKKKSLK